MLKYIPGSLHFPITVHNLARATKTFFTSKNNPISRKLLMALYRIGVYLSVTLRKVQIEENTMIKPGMWLSPYGGIIIGAKSIGSNCTIHQNVTVGMSFAVSNNLSGKPTIGNNVTIEANSLIYGSITIGDGAIIKEGSVVSKNVPDNAVVKGNPAKIVRR